MKLMNLKISFHKIISTLLLTTLTLSLTSFTEFKNTNDNLFLNILPTNASVGCIANESNEGFILKAYKHLGSNSTPTGPVLPPTTAELQRDTICDNTTVDAIDEDWFSKSPPNGAPIAGINQLGVDALNRIMLHYFGYFMPPRVGEIEFLILADDGTKLFLNDKTAKNNGSTDNLNLGNLNWIDKGRGGTAERFDIATLNPIKFDLWYYEEGGGDNIELQWKTSSGSYERIPRSFFRKALIDVSISLFDGVDDTEPVVLNGKDGQRFASNEIVTPPSRPGYQFAGWQELASDGLTLVDYDLVTNNYYPSNNKNLYAKYSPAPLTITYDSTSLAGATTTNPTNFDVTSNTINLTNPTTRIGYTFEGWYDASEGGIEITNIPQGSTASLTLYARWELKEHKIRFFDYPTFIEFDDFDIDYGVSTDSITYPNLTLTNGFEFVQWQPTLPSNMPDEDILLYPVVKRKIINNDNFQINSLESNYLGGYIVVDLDESDSLNSIFIDSALSNPSSPTDAQKAVGAISRYTDPNTQVVEIYYGTGTSVTRFGYVDNSLNGLAGNKLKIYFENSVLLNNGDFEQSLSTGWTVTNSKINLPGDAPLKSGGQFLTSIINNSNNSTYGLNNIREIRGNFSSPLLNHSLNTSNYARLYTKGTIEHLNHQYNWKIHGPQIVSDVFSAKPGDTIKFDWRAINLGDVYDIRAFLINGDTNTEVSLLDPSKTTGLPNVSTNWATETLILSQQILPSASNNLRFKFIGGGDDATRLGGIEAEFHIDNIKIEDPLIPGSVINDLIKALKYQTKLNTDKGINITTYNSNNERLDYFIGLPNGADNFEAIDKDFDLRFIFNQDEPINISLDLATHFIEEQNFDNSFVISSPAKPNFLILNNNKLTGVGLNSDVGTHELVFTANINDQELYSFGYRVGIQIVNINDAPVYNSSKYPSFKVPVFLNQAINYQFPPDLFNDIDVDDVLTYTVVSGKPSCISISGSGLVTGTCSTTSGFATGTVIRVTDTGGLTAQTTITFSTDVEVRFNTNGGLPQPANQNVVFGENVIRPETDPIKSGYRFDGWYSDINTNSLYNFDVSQNIDNLYAKWTLETYDLNYSLNGGTHSNPSTYTYLTPTFTLNNPIRSHYDFNGWYETQDFSTSPIQQILVETVGSKDLFAKWTPTPYSITYSDMLTPNPNNPTSYTIESPDIELRTFFLKTGYTFIGFFDNDAYQGAAVSRIPNGSHGNIRLFAEWIKASFALVFKDEEGNQIASEFIKFGEPIPSALIPKAEKEGHTFLQWDVSIPSSMPARNVEITAKFKVNQYQLTIKDSLGNIIEQTKLDFDTSLAEYKLDPKEIEDYEFEGWSEELPDTMPASDLEVTANYKLIPKYKIIVYGINDEVLIEKEFKENEEITGIELPDLTNRNDFNFEKWDNDLPTSMPAEEIKIKPIGTIKLATINMVDINGTFIGTIETQIGKPVTLLQPTRIGFNFGGWVNNNNQSVNLTTMPEGGANLTARWVPKVYTIIVAVASLDYEINIEFGKPLGQLVNAQLFGFRFDGWKNNVTGQFVNSNTIFNSPEEINLVPVFTRLNAAETLIATPGFIIEFIVRILN